MQDADHHQPPCGSAGCFGQFLEEVDVVSAFLRGGLQRLPEFINDEQHALHVLVGHRNQLSDNVYGLAPAERLALGHRQGGSNLRDGACALPHHRHDKSAGPARLEGALNVAVSRKVEDLIAFARNFVPGPTSEHNIEARDDFRPP